jgi:hypothetical protein
MREQRNKYSLSGLRSTEASGKLALLVAASVPEEDDESSEESSSGSSMSEGSDEKPKAVEEDESSSSSSESSVASDSPPATGKSSPVPTVGSSTDVSESAIGEKKGNTILQIAKNALRTRVVFGKAEGRGKVEVMMGPRFKTKAWKPSTVPTAKGQVSWKFEIDAWGVATTTVIEARRGQTRSNRGPALFNMSERKNKKRKDKCLWIDGTCLDLEGGTVPFYSSIKLTCSEHLFQCFFCML